MPSSKSKILGLAVPMAATQLISMASGFTCMGMLAHLGQPVLAASALIFSVSLTTLMLGMSLLFSLSILVSHAFGAKDYEQAGSLWQYGCVLALVFSIPIMLISWYIYPMLIFFRQDPALSRIVQEFFQAGILRIPLLLLAVSNQQLLYGVNKQRIEMIANFSGVAVLVPACYVLLYGKLGFPALGVRGFAYACVLQALCYLCITSAALFTVPYFAPFHLFKLRLHKTFAALRHLLTTGWPIALQINAEMASFLVCSTFIGWIGAHELAAYQVMMQYQFLIVVPVFALMQANGILIGQAYGAKTYDEIRAMGKESIKIALIIAVLTGLPLILVPNFFASAYMDVNDPHNAFILHLVRLLFIVMVAGQLFDSVRNVVTGGLRGLLDNRFPMLVGLAAMWLVGIRLGYIFCFHFQLGAVGLMLGWCIGIVFGTFIVCLRWQKQLKAL